jgi:uncharacterized membrane protein YoaK (UPF0700 family)
LFSYKITDNLKAKTDISWFLLSFAAGAINAGGYLSCRRYVSHVTGFVTLSGVGVVKSSFFEVLESFSIPMFFLIGVILSGVIIQLRYDRENENDRYAPAIMAVVLLLGLIIYLGRHGHFGVFGTEESMEVDYLLIALLASTCGVLNATVTTATKSTIRPTHLTGITTDLGLGIARVLFRREDDAARTQETRTNGLRASLILVFFTGTISGAYLCGKYQYNGFILPMVLAALAGFSTGRKEKVHFSNKKSKD